MSAYWSVILALLLGVLAGVCLGYRMGRRSTAPKHWDDPR